MKANKDNGTADSPFSMRLPKDLRLRIAKAANACKPKVSKAAWIKWAIEQALERAE